MKVTDAKKKKSICIGCIREKSCLVKIDLRRSVLIICHHLNPRVLQFWVKTPITLFPQPGWVVQISLGERVSSCHHTKTSSHACSSSSHGELHQTGLVRHPIDFQLQSHIDFSFDSLCLQDHHTGSESTVHGPRDFSCQFLRGVLQTVFQC